jgi:hypothetical protein
VALVAVLFALASLGWINGNQWALAAPLAALLATLMPIQLPRWRFLYYVFYPAHLWALWGIPAWLALNS